MSIDPDVLEPMLASCRARIELHGTCMNTACYLRGDRELVTVFYVYPEDAKDVGAYALGAIGSALGATMVVCVMDAWVRDVPLGEELDVRPGEDPRATEALTVSAYTPGGPMLECHQYGYGRADDGAVVWREPNVFISEEVPDGEVVDAWMLGFTSRPITPAGALFVAAQVFRGAFGAIVLDDELRRSMGEEIG